MTRLILSALSGTIFAVAAIFTAVIDWTVLGWRNFWLANLGDPSSGIALSGGELLTTVRGFNTARTVNVNPSAGLNILAAANATTATYTGILSGDGAVRISDGTHAGTVVLAGANTYSGGTVDRSGYAAGR